MENLLKYGASSIVCWSRREKEEFCLSRDPEVVLVLIMDGSQQISLKNDKVKKFNMIFYFWPK